MSDAPKWDDTEPVSWDETEAVEDVPNFDDTVPEEEAPVSETSAPESAFRGGIEMASGGFIDELAGGLEAAGSVVGLRGLGEDELQMPRGETPEEKKQSLLEVYRAMRDKRRGINKEAEEANPKSYTAGQVVGGGITAFSPVKAAKVPGWLANLGLGATAGAGHSEAETLPELAKDTAKGAAMNFGFGAGFGAVGKAANKASQGAKKVAEKHAVDSLAPMVSGERALANKGLRDKLGRTLLDEQVTTFGASPNKQAERLGPLLQARGKVIGDIRNSVDDQAKQLLKSGDEIGAANRQVDFGSALTKRAERAAEAAKKGSTKDVSAAIKLAKEAKQMGGIPSRSLKDTGEVLRNLGDQIPFKKNKVDWKAKDKALYQVYKNLQKQTDGKIRGFTDRFDEYKDAKEVFALLKEGATLAEDATLRGKGDLIPGLKASVLSSSGSENAAERLGKAALLKFAGDRGHAAVAKSADRIYKMLTSDPEAITKVVGNTKYNGVLLQALKRGNKAFLATHMTLANQDPEYRQLVESLDTGDEG